MKISYRPAGADDADEIAELTIMTAGGMSDFLLQGLFPNTSVKEMLKLAILNEDTPMCYKNTLIAEHGETIIGATNYYPANDHNIPEVMQTFIPQERLDHMANFYNTRVPDSLYIHTMAVKPEYRNTATALDMSHVLQDMAKRQGFQYLSAHVWADNKSVIMALKFAGFKVIEKVDVQRHELLPHDGGMLLMRSPLIK